METNILTGDRWLIAKLFYFLALFAYNSHISSLLCLICMLVNRVGTIGGKETP